jgi:hypothetical protein
MLRLAPRVLHVEPVVPALDVSSLTETLPELLRQCGIEGRQAES